MIRALNLLTVAALLFAVPSSSLAWSSGLLGDGLAVRALSTHDRVLKAAYALVAQQPGPADSSHLPSLEQIRRWEGGEGPDGAWARGNDSDTHHYFDVTGKSTDAVAMTSILAEDLRVELAQANPDPERAAKLMAYIGHYVADAMSPPHASGHHRLRGTIQDDWYDPNWDGLTYLTSAHFRFESEEVLILVRAPFWISLTLVALIFVMLLWRKRKRMRRRTLALVCAAALVCTLGVPLLFATFWLSQQDIRISERPLTPLPAGQVTRAVREAAMGVRSEKVWDRYQAEGWDHDVEREVRAVILPEAARLTAEIWLGACQDRKASEAHVRDVYTAGTKHRNARADAGCGPQTSSGV